GFDDLALVRGSGRQIAEQGLHEAGDVRMFERWVVAALETDARERIARESAATDGTAVVARVDEEVIGQLEQTLNRVMELCGRWLRAAARVQVRTTDVADEERVTGEDKPGFFRPAALICDQVGIVRGCVPRCRQRSHDRVPELDDLTVSERDMLEVDRGSGRQVCRRS